MWPARPATPSESAYGVQLLREHWLRWGFGHWAVHDKESGRFVGRTGAKRHDDWEPDPAATPRSAGCTTPRCGAGATPARAPARRGVLPGRGGGRGGHLDRPPRQRGVAAGDGQGGADLRGLAPLGRARHRRRLVLQPGRRPNRSGGGRHARAALGSQGAGQRLLDREPQHRDAQPDGHRVRRPWTPRPARSSRGPRGGSPASSRSDEGTSDVAASPMARKAGWSSTARGGRAGRAARAGARSRGRRRPRARCTARGGRRRSSRGRCRPSRAHAPGGCPSSTAPLACSPEVAVLVGAADGPARRPRRRPGPRAPRRSAATPSWPGPRRSSAGRSPGRCRGRGWCTATDAARWRPGHVHGDGCRRSAWTA